MDPLRPPIDPSIARLPDNSMDWRFLLPLHFNGCMLVMSHATDDFASAFPDIGTLNLICQLDAPSILNKEDLHKAYIIGDPRMLPFAAEPFDVVAIPFGLPGKFNSSIMELLPLWASLLKPGGTLLMGVHNRRGQPRLDVNASEGAMLPSLKSNLQQAGFSGVRVFGAFPDLNKPAWFLPLTQRSLGFFLRNHFAGKPGSWLISLFSYSFFPILVGAVLPGYFVSAAKNPDPGGLTG